MSRTRVYRIWKAMRRRCDNPKQNRAHIYIEKGVKVCDRWHSFEAFLEDMGEPPTNKHSIDRIDNNLGYFKENCRWATAKEQARNSRTARMVTFNGKTQCLVDWSTETGIGATLIKWRLNAGWPVEDALTKHAGEFHKTIAFNGITMTLMEWSKKTGIARRTLNRRLNDGWPLEDIFIKVRRKKRLPI